ncbi:Actin/actin-like protein [Hortaea werneckii]|nr:Actin/actin-like protein [Hortaea werneckii]RMX94394.1 hypothetical protein D0868_12316 [Hortaea werneckii]
MAKAKNTVAGISPDPLPQQTLILDNGAHTIKAGGLATGSDSVNNDGCHIIPNCIARSHRDKRSYIGPELTEECDDFGELAFRRPVEKGYIVGWESEKAIWDRSFFHPGAVLGKPLDPAETTLVLSEQPNAPARIQEMADEMVFEEFGFGGYARVLGPSLNAYAPSPFPTAHPVPAGQPLECALIIDAGHSHTTCTPVYRGQPLQQSIRRLDIGGKTLTNHLKTLISRTFAVHREDSLVSDLKESISYLCPDSTSFRNSLEATWKGGRYDPRSRDPSIIIDYVLPDYETIKRGFVRPHDPTANLRNLALGIGTEGGRREHILTIGNERFAVPELLFTPSDIGMREQGLAGTVLQSVYSLPESARQGFLGNLLVTGGTSLIPGFVERLENEIRGMVDEDVAVRVARVGDPVSNCWEGGRRLVGNKEVMGRLAVTRKEYFEFGEGWVRRRFAGKTG